MRLGRGHLLRRGGKGGGDEQGLAGHGRHATLRLRDGIELTFEPLIDDAFMRSVHVHHHQALAVLCQDVDALQLRNGAAEWPVAFGQRGGCRFRSG